MSTKKNIRLDLISVDAGTQQRPLDEDVLSRYMALMTDGVEFPPIEVVLDGVNFWLWDGFHRLECARRRGQKTIAAYVTDGNLRDAIWLSFGANKEHGLPRQKGVAGEIIGKILTDTSWSKKSLSAIARHVGVTKQYVSLVKGELVKAHRSSTLTIDDKNRVSELKTAQGSSTLPLSRAPEIEVKTKTGIPYTQRSQEKKQKVQEEPKDAVGQVIPEHLQELFEGRKVIWQFISDLARLRDSVNKHIDMRDQTFSLLNITAFQANYENFRRTLKSAMPYAVCCYCGGEDSKNCKACQGFGLLNKDTYEAAPRELRL